MAKGRYYQGLPVGSTQPSAHTGEGKLCLTSPRVPLAHSSTPSRLIRSGEPQPAGLCMNKKRDASLSQKEECWWLWLIPFAGNLLSAGPGCKVPIAQHHGVRLCAHNHAARGALNNLIQLGVSLFTSGGWTRQPSKGPSDPLHSVAL